MKTFKQLFESTYGEGSFNDEFLIDAKSAEGLHESWKFKLIKTIEELVDDSGYIAINTLFSMLDKIDTIYQAKHETLGYWYDLENENEYNGMMDLGHSVRII